MDMSLDFLGWATKLPSNLACSYVKMDAANWRRAAEELSESGARFLTLWGADDRDRDGRFRIYAAYLLPENVLVFEHEMEGVANPTYPSLASVFPSALRMERAMYDLLGVASTEPDKRGWLRHGGWPETVFPLRRDIDWDAAISSRLPSPTRFSR